MYRLKILFLLCLWTHTLSLNAAVAEEANSQTPQSDVGSLWSAIREKLGHEAQKNPAESNDKGAMQTKSDQEELYILQKVPSQMAPIDKPLVYLHPKANERWVIKEEG